MTRGNHYLAGYSRLLCDLRHRKGANSGITETIIHCGRGANHTNPYYELLFTKPVTMSKWEIHFSITISVKSQTNLNEIVHSREWAVDIDAKNTQLGYHYK